MDVIEKISKLKKLFDAGILTKEEFENKKEQLINNLQNNQVEDFTTEYQQENFKSSENDILQTNNLLENNEVKKTGSFKEDKADNANGSIISTRTIVLGIVLLCILSSVSILFTQYFPWHENNSSFDSDYKQEIQQKDTFISPDLIMAGVHGHVKSIRSEQGNYTFTYDGIIKQWPSEWFDKYNEGSELEREISRDNDGFVSHFYYSTIGGEELVFDKTNGRLKTIESYDDGGSRQLKTFIYDEKGDIIRESLTWIVPSDEYDEDGEVATLDTTYSAHYIVVLEKDYNENWIKRKYDNTVQSRTIEYYN